MPSKNKIEIVFQISKGIFGQAKKLGDEFKGLAKKIGSSFAGQMAALMGFNALINKTTTFLKSSIQASMEQEQALTQLANVFEVTGRSIPIKEFHEWTGQIQQATVYGDEMIEQASALIAQLTDLNEDGLKEATKGAIGLAQAFGISLQSASTLVAKALAGNYGALSRYGIQVEKTMSDEEKRASILKQLARMYAVAEKSTDTFAGRLQQVSNAWSDLKEKIGDMFTASEQSREGLVVLREAFEDIGTSITELSGQFSGVFIQSLGFVMKAVADVLSAFNHLRVGFQRVGQSLFYWMAKADIGISKMLGHTEEAAAKERALQEQMNAFDEEIDKQAMAVATISQKLSDYADRIENLRYQKSKDTQETVKQTETHKRFQQAISDEVQATEELSESVKRNMEIRKQWSALYEQGLEEMRRKHQEWLIEMDKREQMRAQKIQQYWQQQWQTVQNLTQQFLGIWQLAWQESLDDSANVFERFAKTIVRAFEHMIEQMLAKAAVWLIVRGIMSAMGAPAGAGPTLGQFLFGGSFHKGGLVYAHAGLLKRDEVPVIAQTGERILSREETARYEQMNRPATGGVTINIQGTLIDRNAVLQLIKEQRRLQRRVL